jgi:glutathione S-transferase
MRTLYHFQYSPFSRRVRLALAHKGLDCELRDGREKPELLEEARRLVPIKTLPILVEDGRALADSTAITRWLDAEYPSAPRLWPGGEDALAALEVTTLVDVALNAIVDVGTRYFSLRESPAWKSVTGEMLGRVQRALDGLAERIGALERPTVARSGWSVADMWLFTAVAWCAGMPERANQSPNIAQILAVGGWTLPGALSKWADAQRGRADVRAMG